jgi:hypothetical protein
MRGLALEPDEADVGFGHAHASVKGNVVIRKGAQQARFSIVSSFIDIFFDMVLSVANPLLDMVFETLL